MLNIFLMASGVLFWIIVVLCIIACNVGCVTFIDNDKDDDDKFKP